jgi:hypothetical protein
MERAPGAFEAGRQAALEAKGNPRKLRRLARRVAEIAAEARLAIEDGQRQLAWVAGIQSVIAVEIAESAGRKIE